MSRFQRIRRNQSRGAMFLAALAVLSIAALACLSSCGRSPGISGQATAERGAAGQGERAPDPDFVVAHSEGIVSRYGDISVVLGSGRDSSRLVDANPFSFEPAIPGTVSWSADGSRADFRPSEALKPGVTYKAVFDFAKIGESGNGWFSFKVKAAEPGVSIEPGALYAAPDGSLALGGSVRTDDVPSTADVERLVTAKVGGKVLRLSWSHEGGGVHRFTVKDIPRPVSKETLELSWNGKAVGSGVRGSKRYELPAAGTFQLLSVTGPEPGQAPFLTLAFSEPVDKAQDFRGLIRAGAPGVQGDLRYEAEGGMVKVYSSLRWPEKVDVTVERGVRSKSFQTLVTPVSAEVRFDWEKPEVRFQAGGVIVPSTQGTKVVLETRNLATVYVEALRVYGDNMLQFLQVNELGGSEELKRVGDVVWRKEIDLHWTDDKKNQWTQYALDLSPLVAKHPDGLFQLRVAFGHDHIRYVSPKDYTNLGKWKFPKVGIDDGDESSNWDYYDEWFDWDEYYRYRDDPAHPAFYVRQYGRDRTARRNVLVSDVGLSAKLDVDGAWHIVASDLRSAKPLPGAHITMYGYSMQAVAKATADKDGKALVRLDTGSTAPFFLVAEAAEAKSNRERGYLKLSQALAVSHFDVGGEKAGGGIKGFIYGERGVWRPGDDIHLTFVLHDRLGTLPAGHPVRFELENPLGQVVRRADYTTGGDGFIYMKTGTDAGAPTGTWTAYVTVGGTTFTKALKVESVMPNRLKLALDYGTATYVPADLKEMGLKAAWLHGAPAPGLKADVSMFLSDSAKAPGGYTGFSFHDPLREAPSQRKLLYEGFLDRGGNARFPVDLAPDAEAPGPMTATFLSRAFERSGLFSTETFSVDFHPYSTYVGVKLPKGDESRGMLLTDRDHPVEIMLVDRDGKPAGDGLVEVAVYKLAWRWWWEKGQESLAEQASDIYRKLVKKETVTVRNGRGAWKLRIDYPEWGRYLIHVTDKDGGHAAGTVFYIDWPGWAGRSKGEGGGSAVMLTLSADKDTYSVGDPVRVSFPSNIEGRAYVTVERAGRILEERWVEAKAGTTVYEFKAGAAMAPNVYVHVSFMQPHLQTLNDLPIRLYGVIPVMVEDPETRLDPVITAPASLEPMKKARVTVSERAGKAMTYTLAVVDEGLLGITRYVTPNPWNQFYAKEASLITSYDLYKDVAGAFSGKLQTLVSIGGSEFGDGSGTRKVSRFPPVVRYLGPFTLAKGGKGAHELELGPYVGAVRLMVVAGTKGGAFGSKELEVPVRADLMAYLSAPRVLGPGERMTVPVSLLGFMGKDAKATVTMKVEGQASLAGEGTKTVRWAEEGEQAVSFEVAVGDQVGAVRLTVEALGTGGRVSRQSVDIPVRSSAIPVTAVFPLALSGKAAGTINAEMPGMGGSNEAWLELSLAPPIDLSGRLAYLIGYPHGCGEQVTSKAFPQLFLADAMNLGPEQAEEARANVAAAITKLAGFQLGSGGFVFWPGSYEESPWLSAYVTHFLVMARRQGFTVSDTMLNPALAYLKTQARAWNAQQEYSKAEQAYRLYVLALAGTADIASMNRFMEYSPFPVGAQYQLAAAYALAGMVDRSRAVLKDAAEDARSYPGMEKVYGSVLRDRALLLDALNVLGDTARALPLYRKLAGDLSSGSSWSTQDLSFALVAALPFLKTQAAGSASVRYTYAGGSGTVTLTKAMARIPLDAGAGTMSLKMENGSAAQVFARVVATGTPEPGAEQTCSEGLALAVRYLDGSERVVDPAREPFGSDLIAEVTVRNTSGEALSDVALTYRIASGWELANLRVGRSDEDGTASPESSFDYQDIRDDRVMTYFALGRGMAKRFRFSVNKTYDGLYFLPALNAEGMYSPDVFAVVPGRPLPAPITTPRSNPNSGSGKP